jgi:hypothetical protein
VRIPRCRATVSEEIAAGHWEIPGKAGWARRTQPRPDSLSQEIGANRQHQPLSRVKGGVHAVLANFRNCSRLYSGCFR